MSLLNRTRLAREAEILRFLSLAEDEDMRGDDIVPVPTSRAARRAQARQVGAGSGLPGSVKRRLRRAVAEGLKGD